jgi:hypothetical protein
MFGQVILLGISEPPRPPEALSNTFNTSDSLYVIGDTITFDKPASLSSPGGGNHLFPIRNGVQFRIKLYGASGGYHNGATSQYGSNSNGGIIDATIDLSSYANTSLYIYKGGAGQNAESGIDGYDYYVYTGGRYNGGGRGAGVGGASGGGRTDLRVTTSYATELLVAGGGGGGLGSFGTSSSRYSGRDGGYGYEGDYEKDNAGGGGGYYGGNASDGDDTRNGGPGSNYYDSGKTITVHQDTRINGRSGGNQSGGWFEIEVISVS